jgi:nucleotide-binding universal stress UspA family protein
MTLRRVVVGVDGSPSSDQALAWVAELAGGSDTEIIIVHGWSEPEAEGEGERVVREASDYLGTRGIRVRSRIEMTDPRELLIRIAESDDADVIVIGSRGKNLLLQVALGSVGEYLTHHSPRPVTIIRYDQTVRSG